MQERGYDVMEHNIFIKLKNLLFREYTDICLSCGCCGGKKMIVFDMDGNICVWGERAQIYSELDKDNFIFKVGQYPGHCRTGEKYTIRQCLVYGYETGQKVQATFVFNITIE